MRIKESHRFYSVQGQGGTARVDVEAVDIEAVVSYPEDLAQQTGECRSAAEIFQRLFQNPFIPQCHVGFFTATREERCLESVLHGVGSLPGISAVSSLGEAIAHSSPRIPGALKAEMKSTQSLLRRLAMKLSGEHVAEDVFY